MSHFTPTGKLIIYQLLPRLFGNRSTVQKSYGTRAENGVGKFNDITTGALEALKEMGITHVWYTGILAHAMVAGYPAQGISGDHPSLVKGLAGSPYAVKDYFEVDADLAVNVPRRMQEFEALVARTHGQGLRVLIDFIPNHVARTYHPQCQPADTEPLGMGDDATQSFHQGNNFYYLPGQTFQVPAEARLENDAEPYFEQPAKVTGNDVFSATPSVHDWYDVVKLNYGVDLQAGQTAHFEPVPNTWFKMRDILLFWAAKAVDGFRCDMVEMVPVAFWQWVIPQVTAQYPHMLFLGELYDLGQYRRYIQEAGFHYLYDKSGLYDTLRNVLAGHADLSDIAAIQAQNADLQDHLLHFMENHDEQRLAAAQLMGDGWKALPAMVLSATADRGAIMIYAGQEVGEEGTLPRGFSGNDGRTSIFDYGAMPRIQQWMNDGRFNGGQLSSERQQLRQYYTALLRLAGTHTALTRGDCHDLTGQHRARGLITNDIHLCLRTYQQECLLIVTGFNPEPRQVTIEIPQELITQSGISHKKSGHAKNILWQEHNIAFNQQWQFSVQVNPYSSFIFKIE